MPFETSKCKITVLKRTLNQDLMDQFLDVDEPLGACTAFADGQQVVVEHPYGMPEGFCHWAWADIRHDIMAVATGANLPWIKQPGTALAGCTDWFRPVIFKIERLEEE